MAVTRSGDGWYADDSEYVVGQRHDGWKITRGDGSYAIFLDRDDAIEAAEMLATGERDDSDYEWSDR